MCEVLRGALYSEARAAAVLLLVRYGVFRGIDGVGGRSCSAVTAVSVSPLFENLCGNVRRTPCVDSRPSPSFGSRSDVVALRNA